MSPSSSDSLKGTDIAKILSSHGPIVQAVLLKAKSCNQDKDDGIEQISVDTTPSKADVERILGGPFTFLGQYEDEGIVLMIRKPYQHTLEDSLADWPLSRLRAACHERKVDLSHMIEKQDLIAALQQQPQPSINPHKLQPPLEQTTVHGDILVLKVASTDDDQLENPEQVQVLTNEEFFLDYTKQDYLKFAARTDIVPPLPPPQQEQGDSDDEEEEEEEDSNDEQDDSNDEDYVVGQDNNEDGFLDDEEKGAMLNLVMGEVLKRFREDHGRGPNSQEVLQLRSQVAKQLGVQLPPRGDDPETNNKKRPPRQDDEHGAAKRVKFSHEVADHHDKDAETTKPSSVDPHDQDQKPASLAD